MYKKIIDQNYLRLPDTDDILDTYLVEGNFAILTDYSAYESTRGNAKINLRKSIEKIKKYPNQVLVLKNNIDFIRISNSPTLNPDDLIDYLTSKKTSEIFDNISNQDALLENNSRIANEWFNARTKDAIEEINNLRNFKQLFSQNELNDFRNWNNTNIQLIEKIVKIALEESYLTWKQREYTKLNDFSFHANNFVFRFCLSGILLRLEWIKNAMFNTNCSSIVASNITDATYYTFGTYFDGCLTKDNLSITNEIRMRDCLSICYK